MFCIFIHIYYIVLICIIYLFMYFIIYLYVIYNKNKNNYILILLIFYLIPPSLHFSKLEYNMIASIQSLYLIQISSVLVTVLWV